MFVEFTADPELLKELRRLSRSNEQTADAVRQHARSNYALVGVLRALVTNRNATSVAFGPLQILDKPKE